MKKQKPLLKMQSVQENSLHKSQFTSSLGRLASIDNVHHSFISLNDDSNSQFSNSFSKRQYKYERVNNMFQLVEVKSNHDEEKVEKQTKKMIRILQKRVEALEEKQKKENNEMAELLQNGNNKTDYLEQKIGIALSHIKQFKNYFEEIRQKQQVYELAFTDFKQVSVSIQEVRQKLTENAFNANSQIKQKVENLQKQFMKQLHKNKCLNPFQFQNPEYQYGQYDHRNNLFGQRRSLFPFQKQFHYKQTYTHNQQTYLVKERTYYIDQNGKLFDERGYYLLDNDNKPIFLNQEHLTKLKQFGILK